MSDIELTIPKMRYDIMLPLLEGRVTIDGVVLLPEPMTSGHRGRGAEDLSHAVIDEDLDWAALNAMVAKDADKLRSLPVEKLIRGTSEIRNRVVAAGALEHLDMTIVDYVPYYRSPAGTGCAGGFAYWPRPYRPLGRHSKAPGCKEKNP